MVDLQKSAIYILGSSAMLRCCPKAGALLGQGEGEGGEGGWWGEGGRVGIVER